MKYVIIIPDGCADEAQSELDGKTPLQSAATPTMDEIAKRGVVGRANHTPTHLPAGSSVANMSLLGYSPLETTLAGPRSKQQRKASNWAMMIGASVATWSRLKTKR